MTKAELPGFGNMQVLTYSEKLLLSSVGVFAISLTVIVIFCVVRKSCWLHKAIWDDDKKKKPKMNDIICIRYPPDIYPTSLGIYRENLIRSPEEELARLFGTPANKRDSTYSSMSETSSGYEITSGSNTTTVSSPITATVVSTPESPEHTAISPSSSNGQSSVNPVPIPHPHDRRMSLSQLQQSSIITSKHNYPIPLPHAAYTLTRTTNKAAAAAIAAEAAVAANQRFSIQNASMSLNPSGARQPFFTFILKYEEDNGLVIIEFIAYSHATKVEKGGEGKYKGSFDHNNSMDYNELMQEARNIPGKEYLSQPSDVFFTLEIHSKKPNDRKKESIRYRFVTKTIKKAGEICDFTETFLAQLSKSCLKEYVIRFSAFDQDRYGNPTEIGSTMMSFDDFRDFTSNKLVLSCSLKEPIVKRGDVMVGLCYLPTAERVSVTIVKLANLNPFVEGLATKPSICYVRLLLLKSDTGKVIKRKKTTFQKLSGSNAVQPVFNETIVFDMPPAELVQTVLLVLVCLTDKPPVKVHRNDSALGESGGTNHPEPSNKTSEDSLFHYSHNLRTNKTKRSESQGSSSSSGSTATSQQNSDKAKVSEQNPEERLSSSNDPSTNTTHGSSDSEKYGSVRSKDSVIGKVPFGYYVKNPIGKYHWEQMMRTPRNVLTEWHSLK